MEQLKKAKNMCRLVLVLLFLHASVHAQRGLGTNTPNASAILELKSTTKGFLLPRMTTVNREAISNLSGVSLEGLMVYDTDKETIFIYVATTWREYYRKDQIKNHDFITVDALGNVGIGAPTPSSKLHVNGDIFLDGHDLRFSDQLPFGGGYVGVRQGQFGELVLMADVGKLFHKTAPGSYHHIQTVTGSENLDTALRDELLLRIIALETLTSQLQELIDELGQ